MRRSLGVIALMAVAVPPMALAEGPVPPPPGPVALPGVKAPPLPPIVGAVPPNVSAPDGVQISADLRERLPRSRLQPERPGADLHAGHLPCR